MKRTTWAAVACVLALAMVLSACAPAAAPTAKPAEPTKAPAQATSAPTAKPAEATKAPAAGKFKVAFVYIGPPGDMGWTYEHDRGRKMLEKEFGDKIETTTVENVPEGPDATRVIRDLAQKGYNMIFTTSFGYMDPTIEVAKEFPKVYFEHCSGYKTADNVSTYFGQIEVPRYLSGMVAGLMTKTNIIGYVGAMQIPEVIRGCNAFTLGVKAVNPKAEVRMVWTNTWYDPVKEREAALGLLAGGADIIAQHQDTTEPQKAAKEQGKLSIGYDSDMSQFVGDTVLTGPVWNWGAYYVQTVKDAMEGKWKSHQFWGGLKENVVMLAPLSPRVPADVKAKVEAEEAKFKSGEKTEFDIFAGPLKDNTGVEKVPAGKKMTQDEILNMDWFVEGVKGSTK